MLHRIAYPLAYLLIAFFMFTTKSPTRLSDIIGDAAIGFAIMTILADIVIERYRNV